MTVRNGGFPGDYNRNSFDSPGGCDDSPNASKDDETFGVRRIVLPLSDLSSSERRKWIHTLRQELEQLRSFQKSVGDLLPISKIVTSTPASNVSRPKSFGMSRCSTGPGKRVLPFTATKPEPVTTSTMLRMKQCESLLKRLMSQQHCWLFNTPVDVVKLNIPDYFTIIKHPMDLGTVKSKLTSGTYSSPSEFSADVRLTFRNAMTYNPSDNNVYRFADTLSKFFEVRWKTIEKSSGTKSEPSNLATLAHKDIAIPEPVAKKRKMNAVKRNSLLEPAKRVMTDEDRVKLGRDLGSLTEFPVQIINFLRDHSSKEERSGDDEIEIDINDLSHDALFQLRDLFDEFLRENQKKDSNGEPCVLELLHGSGPGNSLTQHCDGSELEDEDVDIGNYEHPISHISTVRTEKDSVGGLNQMEDASRGKLSLIEGADGHQDGNSAPKEKELPPEKRYRAALLKNRFADIILKAQEITLNQNEKRDPETLQREKEELELQKKKEKARLQAEAKEAEEARRKAEAQEAKRKLELEREAARQALLEMEKSVEINENTRFLKDLELLKTVNTDQLRNLRDVGSESDGLAVFGFGGSNPLEQLGLFMKHEEDEDESDMLAFPDPGNEVEEGEID